MPISLNAVIAIFAGTALLFAIRYDTITVLK